MSVGSRVALVLAGFTAVLAAACNDELASGDTATADDTGADVAESEVDTTPETRPETVVDSASEAEVVDPHACDNDDDCTLSCAHGRCADHRCVWAGAQADGDATGCVVDVPEAAPSCVAPGAADPSHACFVCNPTTNVVGFGADVFASGFEPGAHVPFEVTKLAPSPATWTISTRRAARGTSSLYFGDAATGSYDVGERAAATATTTALMVAPGYPTELTFWLWAETEQTLAFDRLRVLLVVPGGEARELWTSDAILGDTRGVFVPVAIALGSEVPAGAQIAFEADTTDERINHFEGFYLDDIRLFMACCDAAPDGARALGAAARSCDDGLACTDDACAQGVCTFTPRADCCETTYDCDDGDACTDDVCPSAGGACAHTPRDGCCTGPADCSDGNACTEDLCENDHCKNAPICCEESSDCDDGDACTVGACDAGQCHYSNACCAVDGDCDDGEACTLDTCEPGGLCANTFSYAPGCCIPDVLTERFDSATVPWTFSPAVNNIGWRLHTNAQAKSGTSVLYYGHPTLNFYESGGKNLGSATSPRVQLPDGVSLQLVFWVSPEVEADLGRDKLTASLVLGANGTESVPLIDKSALTVGAWQEIAVDVSWAAGQYVQVRFDFDTVDGIANTGHGILIDDVRILSNCVPRPCDDDSECGSRASCVTGHCADHVCLYGGGC